MSAGDGGGPVGRREVAYRLFAAEFDDADLEYSDSDEERAPNYVVTPTGARVNRLFAVGVLTEVEPVSDDVLRARVVDPTGAFVVYAGQYQPEAVGFLEGADVPSFVAVTGKARTFQPDGSDRVFTSVRPESLTEVDTATRDRWTVQAAEHTLVRIATMARALDREARGDELARALEAEGVDPGLAAGTALAIDHYGTTRGYLAALRELAVAAAEVVTGDREAVPDLELDPGDEGPVEVDLTAAPAVAGTLTAALEAGPAAGPAGGEAAAGSPTPVAEPAAEAQAADEAEPDPSAADERPAEPADAEEPSAEPADAEEPTAASTAADAPADEGDLGDFEARDVVDDAVAGEDEAYELDEAERAAVEEEFGTEFSTGSEVGEPGEAGLETETEPPATDADEGAPGDADEAADAPEVADEAATEDTADEARGEDGAAEGADGPGEVDLEDAAVEAMLDLDDGDGADHDAVVEAVVDAHGVDPEAVEDAIQEALMGGRCYEPADGRLKAI